MSQLKLAVTSWGEVALDKKELRALMRSAGNDVRTKTQRIINRSQGSGRTYRGGGGSAYRGNYRPGTYRASAAAEPPVRVSGTLRSSLRTYVYPEGNGFAVRERAFYALFLEAGARGGGNPGGSTRQRVLERRHRARSVFAARVLLPRPHLDRVMQQEEANLQRRVRKALDDGLTWKQTKS